jgi:hypothetical protein
MILTIEELSDELAGAGFRVKSSNEEASPRFQSISQETGDSSALQAGDKL